MKIKFFAGFILICILIAGMPLKAMAEKPPYPIILIHGLNSSYTMWDEVVAQFKSYGWTYGGVLSVDLNKDDNNNTGSIAKDVEEPIWKEFDYNANGDFFLLNFDTMYSHSWDASSLSNQAAIRKQGKALNLCIKEILVDKGLWYNQVNGRVILIGHSMGGLSAREYLQRLSDDLMPNNHEWWVKPNEEGGHRVARLVTIGTPHLGSWMWNFKIISGVENKSEATRDLRCNDGTGVYLFGGFESDIPDSFYNKDVNCDGNNNTLYRITGLNEYDKKGKLKMPLPSDVKYVCIIGNASELYGTPFGLDDSDGDGVVDKMRQNLNSVVPNIATEFIIPACHVDALKPLYQYSVLSECKYHGTIYQALFDTIPKVRWHPDGTLIKSPVSCKAYVLENGKKRHIPDPSTFTAWRYDWGKVITVSTEELNGYPTGIDISPPPSGYPCIRQVGTRVFLIKDGKKHHILSPRVFDSWGYEWSENKVVGSIVEPSGEPVVYREGTLIHGVPSGKVYVVSNETLWHIQDIETFKLLGYNTKNMIDVSDSVLTNTSLNGLKGICFRNINIAYVTSFHKNNGNCPWVVPPPSSPPGVVAVFAGNPYPIPITVFDEAGDISVEVWQTSDDWKNANRIYSSTIAVHSPGSDKYTWTVPNVNTNEAELRIVAYNDAGNVGCAYSGQFSISSSGSIPSTHELYDPGNYTENNYYTISWREISDATSYTLQESTDSSFRQIREYSTTARPQYIAGKENGIYYYRVRANNSQGSSGWSNIVDLEVRVNFPPYTPSNPNIPDGATNVSRMPALTWTGGDPDGTVDYAVRFGTNTSDMCYRKCFGVDANPTYQFSYDLAPGTTYYWQIRAKDDKGLETFGPLWRFTTAYSYADLIPVSLVVDGTITPNSRVTLNLTVKNQGTYVAPWGRVFFYYSSSKGGKEQKLYNFGTLIPELAPGAQTTISQVVTLENLKAGKGYIDAWINTEGYFIEGNIDNNLLSYEINYLDNNSPVISYLGFQWKVFRTGYKYPVGFVVSDDIGIKDLDFYYSTDNGLTWGTITTGFVVGSNFVQNAYYWTIPPDAPLTDQLKIRMVAWDTAMNRTEAMAGPYKIVSGTPPSVKILSPNGGEVWNLGSQQEIKWEVSAPNGISGMSLGIYYRGDRDENDYIDIKTNTTGRYTWTLPNSSCCVTNEARVKIEVSDLNGNRSEDWSDGYFSINDPSSPPLPPWTMPEKITSILSTKGEQYNSNPVVVADKSGNLHMVYRYIQDDQTSNDVRVIKQEILYKKFSGGSWSEPTTIYSMTQKMGVGKLTGCHSIDDLRIAIDSYGYPHIAWLDTINGPFTYFNQDDIYYTYFNGSIWTIPLNISSIAQPLDFTWTTKANMPETKKEAASGMVNGKIYVFGGNDIISNYEYNPTNNTWTRKADLPLCIGKGGAAVINNKIYAVPSYNNIQIYDPVNDSWSTGASIPTLRWGIGVCAVNGRVYAIGGASDKFFNTVEEYNPMTDSWVTKKPMPTARCSSAVAVVNNLMYVFGGKDASNYSSIDTVEVYNPSTDSWSAKASMPTRREGAVAKVINGKIYVIGGRDGSYLNIVERYDPTTDRWNSNTSMPTARAYAVSEVIGNKIYVIGGYDSNNSLSVVEEGTLTGEDVEQTVSRNPEIAINSSNNVYIAWQDGYSWNSNNAITGQSNIYYRSKNNNGQWSSITQVTTGGAWEPSVIFDKNDNLHLAYCLYPQNIAYIKWDGSTWSSPMTVTTSARGQIDLISDNNNHLHMVWYYDHWSPQINQILYSYYNGSSWSSSEEVSDKIPGQYPCKPFIMVDSLGFPHIVYEEHGNKYKLMYKRKTLQSWSSPIQINIESQNVESYSSNATISQDNQIHAVWTSSRDGHQEVFYNHANALTPLGDTVPPVVNLLTPIGGESLSIGSTCTITWNASDNIGVATITLKYSIDNGATFTDIAVGISNSGTYEWRVPNITSSSVQVWIFAYDTSGNVATAISKNFSISDITAPSVSIIKPNGGEIWEGGSWQEILWQALDNVGISSIDILYSIDSGESWKVITEGTSNSGSYSWTVPDILSCNCLIKVIGYDAVNHLKETISKGRFTIKFNNPPIVPHSPVPVDKNLNVGITPVLSWQGGDVDNNVVLHDVYFGTTSTPPLIFNKQSEISLNVGTLSYNTTYYWYITAFDGNTSTSSSLWSFATKNQNIKPPVGLRVSSAFPDKIFLVWSCDSSDISEFRIERKTGIEGSYSQVGTVAGNVTSYKDSGLMGNTAYVYRIMTFYNGISSEYSSELQIKTPNTPPSLGNLLPSDSSINQPVNITLTWSGSNPDLGDTMVYDVYFGSITNPPLVSAEQTKTTYSPGILTYFKYYFWKVVAKDSYDACSASPVWSFVTKVEPVPTTPNNLLATVISGTCTDLSWTDNSDNEIAFKVERKVGNDDDYRQIIETDTSFYKDTEISGNTTYYYRARAYNKSGDSIYSNEANVRIPNNAPNIPSNPWPSNDTTNQSIDRTLNWTGGDPDIKDTVTYDVYLGTSTIPPLIYPIQGETFYNPGTLSYGNTYYWKIMAKDNYGDCSTSPVWSFSTEIEPMGSISVTSVPAGANIFLDEIDKSTVTPAILIDIIPGTHTIKLIKHGYYDWSATVTVTAEATTPIIATLTLITGTISITSIPSGASILLDGTSTGTVTPAILTGIIPCTHTVTLTKSGYYDWIGTITVPAEATTDIIATLTLITGSISVTSTPAGANILLDGIDTGTITPATLTDIIPGTHTIKLTKHGYYDWSGSVTVTAEVTTDVTATLTLITGSISVTSTPPGANILLDGVGIGTITPAILTDIISGTHTLTLTKSGYYDWTGTVTVPAEVTTDVTATLTLITGSISVASTPAGANILLDGIDTGTITPATLTGIIPGTHTIKLTKHGYYDWSGSVTVTAGTTTPIAATLTLIVNISSPINGAILINATQTLLSGTVTGTAFITGTLTHNGILSPLNITGGSFTTTLSLYSGKNIIIVSVRKQAGNTGFATVIIEVADKKEIIPPGQKPTIALDDSTKIEILDNPFTNATATITINDNPDEANFALADQNLPKGVDISGLAEAVREFKLFERENANAGTTTGRFKITIPYPATIPDDKARDLKIYWLNTDANRWELAGGKSDMANHTVTVEVTHLSIFMAAFLSSPLPPKVIVYPNPYNARRDDRIYFKGTIELSLIRIFTLSGELVKEIKASNNTQDWDVKNAAGCTLASGMYFYLITDTQGNKATGKIAVIR